MTKGGKKTTGGTPVREDLRRVIQSLFDQVENARNDPALDRAQEKVFAAWEARTTKRRVALAKEALAISALCADAYGILADETTDLDEAIGLYRQAETAGRKALGPNAFQEDAGMFWGLIETRPYMRALHGLASALWEKGSRDEATTLRREMLRLNPNDNQGVRYELLNGLLETGRNAEAGALIKSYKNDSSAFWAWSRALLCFREKGNSAAAHKTLGQAVASNPHVSAYLLEHVPIPAELPDVIGVGDEDEAVAYAATAMPAWDATDGAKDWLRASRFARPPAPFLGTVPPAVDDLPKLAESARVDEAVLALLLLGLHDRNRAWKGFNWDALGRLHAKGFISDPAGRAKSVVFTDEGLVEAKRLYQKLFESD
jgi:tetratricopeptide (TPR) repeat protein